MGTGMKGMVSVSECVTVKCEIPTVPNGISPFIYGYDKKWVVTRSQIANRHTDIHSIAHHVRHSAPPTYNRYTYIIPTITDQFIVSVCVCVCVCASALNNFTFNFKSILI